MTSRPASTGSSVLDEIAEVIGEEAAFQLARHFGGRFLYVPNRVGPNHPITIAIGAEAAAELVDHFRDVSLAIPKSVERRRRVLQLANRLTRSEIAAQTHYSERQVYRILAENADDKPRQPDLFDGDSGGS